METSIQSFIGTSPILLPAGSTSQTQACVKHSRVNVVGMQPLPYKITKGKLRIGLNLTCAAAGATATQPVTRNSRTNTLEKVKSPKLSDNGPGLPPRDDDGNGGNGGGGGGNFSGGLALLGILGVLDILKDIEGEFQRKSKADLIKLDN